MKVEVIDLMIPAGAYYIGDLCFTFNRENWKKVCSSEKTMGEGSAVHSCKYKDYIFVSMSVGGDGDFMDNSRRIYSVESGSIGILPAELIDPEEIESCKEYGHMVSFDKGVLCKFIENELIAFGPIIFHLYTELDEEYERDIVGRKYWEMWD